MRIKWTWAYVLFVILILVSNTSFAKEDLKPVYVYAKNIKVSFPESCYILKQNVRENNPYLARVGANKEDVEQYYKENNIFLHAVAEDLSYEIVCTQKDNDNEQYLTDLSIVPDEEVKKLAGTMADVYSEYGYENISYDYYDASNEKFAVVEFTTNSDEQKVCCEQYFFLLNDKAYYFTLRVFKDEISDDLKAVMKSVVDSVYFYRSSEDMSYFFENEEFGITFGVPNGWEEKGHGDTNQYLITQFAHLNRMGETFQVYAYDIWSDFDIVRKIMTTREKLDTTMGMEQVLANKSYLESFYTDFDNIKIRDTGEPLIYEELPVLLEHESIDGDYYQQNYCILKQGILYVFQYGYYDGSNMHEEEINALLDTVSITEPETFEKDEEAYNEIAKFTYAALAVIATVVLAFVLLIFLYFKSQKQAKE